MKNKPSKNNMYFDIIISFIVPIMLTIIMLFQYDSKNALIMISTLCIIWLIAFIITYFIIKGYKNNPYPFSYLVDYDTLIKYMKEEENYCMEDKLVAGFHYYIYLTNEKIEVQAWHYSFSNIASEKSKGDIFYWNKEEFNSLESLIKNKIKQYDGHVLIELIDSDNKMLNEYKNNHEELDVKAYIEKG